ncbi:hypothetical protein SAMN04488038_11520 [Solimonas aquatica]|uniref:Lipoprotein n=1 Tax=Solimonas aquatica TaxID=489703 RepID=A0A1H9L529_9GAMM|nr:DUF6491 family protein [Solimonas aquatica]SER06554.1 hypothetical protein SAMN04488038_11520 [Solimonas aquatica]
MSRIFAGIALSGSVLLLHACATHAPAADDGLEKKLAQQGYRQDGSVQRIQNYRIDGWNFVDDTHLVFTAGPSRDYLITTLTPCTALRGADQIGFTSTGQEVTTLDKIVVRAIGFTDQCPIKAIDELKRVKKESK